MTKLFLQETIRAFLNVQLDKSFKGDFFLHGFFDC